MAEPVSDPWVLRFFFATAGGIVGAAAKAIWDITYDSLTRPILIPSYSSAKLGCLIDTKDSDGKEMMSVSIGVTNIRRKTAENCRVFLTGIDHVVGGTYQPTEFCDSMPLAWSYRSNEDAQKGIDIPQEIT